MRVGSQRLTINHGDGDARGKWARILTLGTCPVMTQSGGEVTRSGGIRHGLSADCDLCGRGEMLNRKKQGGLDAVVRQSENGCLWNVDSGGRLRV